ncbi:MAG TPA: hypothetical protein VEQ58_11510 [Polyangiaceae bacterium]|nr:hypothetical protein [Polyangiaceae bacterium]
MRIDSLTLRRCLPIALVLASGLLTACPGELENKAAFDAYEATRGDAGAPSNDTGGTAGSAGAAGSAGTSGTAGSAGSAGTDGSAGADDGAVTGACGDVVTRIFVPSCGGTGCHSASSPQQDLDLVSPGVASRVVGIAGKQCAQLLADPQNPEQSLLYQKLLPQPDCGASMPLARPALSGSDMACVLAWIAAQ